MTINRKFIMPFFSNLKLRIILLALIIGTIYTLPHILFWFETKGNYKIFFVPSEAESEVYTGRIHDVYDGHFYISDPYTYENKYKPYLRTYFSELILGLLGRFFHLSILQLLILNNFLFPVALFLLIYYFIFILSKSQNLSLIGSSFILLAEFPEIIRSLIKGSFIELLFSRAINPPSNFIFFILCLIFTYQALEDIKISRIFLAALSFGSVFYTDPYFLSHILVAYALLSAYLMFKKSFGQLKALILIALVGLVISIPYWVNIARLVSLSYFSEFIRRMGVYNTHQPQLLKFTLIGMFLFLFFYRKRDFKFYFLSALLIAAFLCMNQQVITGKDSESWHWYHFTAKQMTIIAIVVLISQRVNFQSIKRQWLIFALSLIIVTGLYIQLSYYKDSRDECQKKQFLYDAFLWLNNHTEVDSVVMASENVSLILPVHTHNNVYTVRWIFESVCPDSELMERFFIFCRLFSMDKDAMIAYLKSEPRLCFGVKPDDPKYKDKEDFFRANKVMENVSREYAYFQEQNIYSLLKRFRLDYIFYGPYEKKISQIDPNKYPFLSKVYDKGDVQIYKIIK